MRIHRLGDRDQVIMHHCEHDFVPLHDLLTHVPRGSVYRRVSNLLSAGLLEKRGRTYRTTEHGKRRLAELASQTDWNIWDQIYPPMQFVPSPPHRSAVELTTVAVVARQADDSQDDHHPAFMLMGPTLSWKTSAAKFQCHLLGMAPAETIIDLTTETGRSLLVRRDGTGAMTFKRNLLDGRLIVFDDVLEAESSLRSTTHHFLSGRKIVPVDNDLLRIAPVSLITLNPRPNKMTLEEQTSFSRAQLRRQVVINLANVALPDLSNFGHLALEEAIKHGPLTLPLPTANAGTWRSQIVGLVREILLPEFRPRVDTEMILTLVTGMTAFIPDPERAIQQTIYDFAMTAETLGWTGVGWSDMVSRFSLHTPLSAHRRRDPESHESSDTEDFIIIRRIAMDGYKESALPPFTISDENKARMIAIGVMEGVPFDHGLGIALDYYMSLEREGLDLDVLHSVLELGKDLKRRNITAKELKTVLGVLKELEAEAMSLDEFSTACTVVSLLKEAGVSPDLEHCQSAVSLAARLLASDIPPREIDQWLMMRAESSPHRVAGHRPALSDGTPGCTE
jgi:DNA-binding PadR family transcriptional regulator